MITESYCWISAMIEAFTKDDCLPDAIELKWSRLKAIEHGA